jgi:chromosome segregation ATPase
MHLTNTRKGSITVLVKNKEHTIKPGETVDLKLSAEHHFIKSGALCTKSHLKTISATSQAAEGEIKKLKAAIKKLEADLDAKDQEIATLNELLNEADEKPAENA